MKQLTVLSIAVLCLMACERAPAPVPDIDITFELTDEHGATVTSENYDGKLRLVFFGFTTCPDICPITLHNIATALNAMGPAAEDVTVLFISVDPLRDTSERLRAYTESIHPAIIGLTGTYEQITDVTSGFRTAFGYSAVVDGQERPLTAEEYEALTPTDAYTPFHSSRVYLIDEDGGLLDMIGYGSKPSLIEAKLLEHI